MGQFTYLARILFADPRPPLDVKFALEKRAYRLLPRDSQLPDTLLFTSTAKSATCDDTSTIELRLEGVCPSHNLYSLRFECHAEAEKSRKQDWDERMERAFLRLTDGLQIAESRENCSPARTRLLVEETIALEHALADKKPSDEERAAVRAVQESIIGSLKRGKLFFTAHHEGGTHIKWIRDRFVFQDYGESEEREEFTTEDAFLARLKAFYDWPSRKDWYPHTPPEIEIWRFIEGQLKT